MRSKIIVLFVCLVCFLGLLPRLSYAKEINTEPKRIIIPSVGIDLDVNEAKIVFDTWEVRLDGASYGEGSALPGEAGNSVIFSHALPNLFGNLVNAKKGEYIHVFTDNDWYVYKITSVMSVQPTQTDVLDDDGQPVLTLYTCDGPNYSERFVVKARLLSTPFSL